MHRKDSTFFYFPNPFLFIFLDKLETGYPLSHPPMPQHSTETRRKDSPKTLCNCLTKAILVQTQTCRDRQKEWSLPFCLETPFIIYLRIKALDYSARRVKRLKSVTVRPFSTESR